MKHKHGTITVVAVDKEETNYQLFSNHSKIPGLTRYFSV